MIVCVFMRMRSPIYLCMQLSIAIRKLHIPVFMAHVWVNTCGV
jgi:hypothetical protein